MDNIDWSKFTLRIPIKADIQEIYKAWITAASLESWFLRKANFYHPDETSKDLNSDIQKGDTYEWHWHGYDDSVYERGEILEANSKDLLKFVFGKAGIVTVSMKTIDNETLVELTQGDIPLDEKSKLNYYVGCSNGWTFYLANLKSILEGGIDLRNKKINITEVINS
jgi:uncharacterized protein YndB with AHSA1/START domain